GAAPGRQRASFTRASSFPRAGSAPEHEPPPVSAPGTSRGGGGRLTRTPAAPALRAEAEIGAPISARRGDFEPRHSRSVTASRTAPVAESPRPDRPLPDPFSGP